MEAGPVTPTALEPLSSFCSKEHWTDFHLQFGELNEPQSSQIQV